MKALFAFADRIEARLATGQKTVERLTPSVLAKAFRGELLPRDPDDEPASVLLERLRASRAQAPVARRPRQTGAPKRIRTLKETTAMTKSRFDDDVKGQPYLANLLLKDAKIQSAEALFKLSELSLVDFYKQLAWEVEHGKIRDDKSKLEAVG